MHWINTYTRNPLIIRPINHNTSDDNTGPRTDNSHRSMLANRPKEPAAEQPDRERRKR
jgi:hypothetical protein